MKIIRHRPVRRLETWTERLPSKKALLVGIQYDDGEDETALRGPHKDVARMQDLLIECYEYQKEDIVILVDTEEPGQIQPTRENMINAIRTLVEDAQPGDHFFFHYAGHTVQIENKNASEEDGMDECIIPSDGEAKLITDNELRRLLVDSLPIGSNLVAIFDSCHSASLLDLQHFRCNRPYVPWVSKGKRRSDSQWNSNVRRQGLVVSRHVYQSKRVSASSVRSRRTTIDQLFTPLSDYNNLAIHSRSLSVKSELEKWYDTPSSPIQRCHSPDSMWPCTGWCPPETPEEANVIALAACKDDQLSWEDRDGDSMTKVLVDILKADPHPPLVILMRDISHKLHEFYINLHGNARTYRKMIREKNKKRAERGLPQLRIPSQYTPEMDNFQDPQMSSHHPIARDALWNP